MKEVGRTLGAIAVTRGSRVHNIGMQEALWMLAPPDSVGSPSEPSWLLGTLCAVHIPAHLPTDMPRHVWASGRHLRSKTHWSPEALEAGIPGCPESCGHSSDAFVMGLRAALPAEAPGVTACPCCPQPGGLPSGTGHTAGRPGPGFYCDFHFPLRWSLGAGLAPLNPGSWEMSQTCGP